MTHSKLRKYPRVYMKQHPELKERFIDMSAITAGSIMAATLIGGISLGYMIRRKCT